jgi:hypothetical protein
MVVVVRRPLCEVCMRVGMVLFQLHIAVVFAMDLVA